MRPRRSEAGNVLAMVMILVVILLIFVPALVKWGTLESKWAVKEQKNTAAFNLAESAVSRGMWKLKSSTVTWATAAQGTTIAGYNFDQTFTDVEGGKYRIRFSSGPNANEVTVIGEGRDTMAMQTRAVKAIYENLAFPGPVLSGAGITYAGELEAHWGPVMAQNNITVSGAAATDYFPRKMSRQAVVGTAGNPRDTNGINPPNTDTLEWWSDYPVPELPQLDFATMRASAAANGTLNYYNGFTSSHVYTGYSGSGHVCNVAGTSSGHANPHNTHFADSNHHPKSKNNLIWYWDGDVSFTGGADLSGHSNGLYGTVIVRGNMTIETEDNYVYTASVPATAWRDYQKIDTSATNQYPGDNGYHTCSPTFGLGSQTWTGGPAAAAYSDVGFRGLIYVGGNLNIVSGAKGDFAGVIWVVGNLVNANTSEKSLVFFDKNINVPVLNVVLQRNSWQEVTPNPSVWP